MSLQIPFIQGDLYGSLVFNNFALLERTVAGSYQDVYHLYSHPDLVLTVHRHKENGEASFSIPRQKK